MASLESLTAGALVRGVIADGGIEVITASDATYKGRRENVPQRVIVPGDRRGRVGERMTADHLKDIEKFEADLWKVADNLRANSNLASNEYFMPILGLIFLRHATNRYYEVLKEISEAKASGSMPDREVREADFTSRGAMMLPEEARYDQILAQPKDGNLGAAVNTAMESYRDQISATAGSAAQRLRSL